MEPALNDILQQQLKGIHMPEAIGWWPIAPGWWVLLILCVLIVGFGLRFLIQHKQRNLYRKQSTRELQSIHNQWVLDADNSQYVQSANAVIKRAISTAESFTVIAEGGNSTSSLTGLQWVKIINSWSDTALSEKSASALSEAGYQHNPEVDVEQLHSELLAWIHSHKKTVNKHSDHVTGVQSNA